MLEFVFWAAVPKGMSCRTQDFCLSVRPSFNPSIHPWGPFRPEICPLIPEIYPLRPESYTLRPWICPLRSEIFTLRPEICPFRPYPCSHRFKAWGGRFQAWEGRFQAWEGKFRAWESLRGTNGQSEWQTDGQTKVQLCSTGLCSFWGCCPASSHSNSQSCKAG